MANNVITKLQTGPNGTAIPIGVRDTNYILKGTETLTSYLSKIETRLANIEACLKEISQTQEEGYEQP